MYLGDKQLSTRKDVAELLLDMIRPLKEFYSEGHAWLHIGDTGVKFGTKAGRMEGFSRIMWGLGPLWAQDNAELTKEYQEEAEMWRVWYLEGLCNGTNPEHEEYWGEVNDGDQKMVEMAAIVSAFMLAPEKLWAPLSEVQKTNLYQWLKQINGHSVPSNNWRFFRILTNSMFRNLGLEWSRERDEEDWGKIESFYTGDGWYFDGEIERIDYYIPFAIQYYSLLYIKFMEHLEPERCAVLRERTAQFSEDFVYWFANNGDEIPFGRSLTYRFAHSAFFAGMGLAEVEGVGYGKMKQLILNNLMQWMKRPIFDQAGIMSIGYGYPNLFMTERYNSPGSPYWALKAFYLLAMPQDHPFWQAKEEDVTYEAQKLLDHPHMLISHVGENHVLAYPTGQHGMQFGCSQDKYEKLVYSNQFGFSVARGNSLLQGAFDNTIAVSLKGEDFYRTRYGIESFETTQDYIKTTYQMMTGVHMTSTVVPCGPWHVRVHEIETDFAIDVADGGFAMEADTCFEIKPGVKSGLFTEADSQVTKDRAVTRRDGKVSGIVSVTGGTLESVAVYPNTNILYSLTLIPTIKHTLEPGKHQLVSCVFGDISAEAENMLAEAPEVKIDGDKVVISYQGKEIEL